MTITATIFPVETENPIGFTSEPDPTVAPGITWTYTPTLEHENGPLAEDETITFSVAGAPEGMTTNTLNPQSVRFEWAPAAVTAPTVYRFTIMAESSTGCLDAQPILLLVLPCPRRSQLMLRYSFICSICILTMFMAGCGDGGSGELGETTATTLTNYRILNLQSGSVSQSRDLSDIASNPDYRNHLMVFKLVQGRTFTKGSQAAALLSAMKAK